MKIIKTGISLAAIALIMGCGQKAVPKNETKSGSEPVSQTAPLSASSSLSDPPSIPGDFKLGIGKVLGGYLPIQKALAEDDFSKAKEAFLVMHGLLHIMPLEGLDSVSLKRWNDSSNAMMEILHPMSASEDMASFRTQFAVFSAQLASLVDTFGARGADSVYQAYCPMAFGNKGAYWLQQGAVITNPYLGKAMPTCGDIKRPLPPS